MALGFFRRRQKMVIIIMVVLMVAFLIPMGISSLFEPKPGKQVIGRWRGGKITLGDLHSARVDLDLLERIGLGNRWRYWMLPTEVEITFLKANGGAAPEAYALLLAEARKAGPTVSEGDITTFIERIGYPGEQYKQLLAALRDDPQAGWSEKSLRATVGNWLLIHKAFVESSPDCPPSEAEIRTVYRDMNEALVLRVLRLTAQEYVKDVPEPNQAQVEAQFNQFRTVEAGTATRPDSFGFGYRQPGRARLAYLLIRGDALERVVEPTFEEIAAYYDQHKSTLVREAPQTAPSSGAAPQTASASTQSAATAKVIMSLSEARETIVERLRAQKAAEEAERLATQAESAARRLTGAQPGQGYARVRQAMVQPAESVLARPLTGAAIDNLPLRDAVARLAEAAGLRAICYPWGTQGTDTLDPAVKVSIKEAKTLGEALGQISQQTKWPKLSWALCEGFPKVLFSVAGKEPGQGLDFFPVAAAETQWMTRQEIGKDKALGYACSLPTGGTGLADAVFTAEGLSTDPKQTPLMRVGAEESSRMYVVGDRPGRLLCRLTAVSPAHEPRDLDDTPDLRRQVVEDLRLQAAQGLAAKAAERVKMAAELTRLETVAAAQKKEAVAIGPLPRIDPDSLRYARYALQVVSDEQQRRRTLEHLRQLSEGFQEAMVKLDLDTPQLRAYVISKLFELAPKAAASAPATQEAGAVTVISLPPKREVLIVERYGYEPPMKTDYEDCGRLAVARALWDRQGELHRISWFGVQNIRRRLDFTPGRG